LEVTLRHRSAEVLQRMLVLTDDGELEVRHHLSDGSCAVVWTSGNRLIKPKTTGLISLKTLVADGAGEGCSAGATSASTGRDSLVDQWEAIPKDCAALAVGSTANGSRSPQGSRDHSPQGAS
jgi:hypothetical protein